MLILPTIFFVFGIWLLQQQAELPDIHLAWWLLLTLPALRLPQRSVWLRIARSGLLFASALACGFLYAAWMAQQRLTDELPPAWQGHDITLTGVVAEMPRRHERGAGFVFDVENIVTPNAHVPRHILLSIYRDGKSPQLQPHAGERWQFTVRLKQPHGTSNPHQFDFEAWALERDLRAVGYVHNKGDNRRITAQVHAFGYHIEQLRETIRTRFQNTMGDAPYAGVLSALAIGDQGSISASQWQIFTRTGVNHLMSISGLHITLLAGFAFALTYHLWRRSEKLTLHLPARKAAALIGFAVALAYALLAGYGIPAQRTVYMLACVVLALWSSRNIAPAQTLAAALLLVSLLDPWAVLSAGFWLSFAAVALIFYLTANRIGVTHWLVEYTRVQWAMSIGLIPLLLALFQQLSVVSPAANAIAIPLVSFIVVPLTLLGVLLPLEWPLQLAHQGMALCMALLEWLNSLPVATWTQHAPPAWSIVIGMFGVSWVLLPRGFPGRWLGLLLMLPMFMSAPQLSAPGKLRLIIFDVGQGLAVAAQTREHALLYDAGPDYSGDADSGNRILVPALRGLGISHLDSMILSHDDIDHIGGAASVLQAIPTGTLYSTLTNDHDLLKMGGDRRRCSDGQNWEWNGVRFEILHPRAESPAQEKMRDNDSSCVLRISTGGHHVLLGSDIERSTEKRLLAEHADKLPATLLIVPHHGSKSSSSEAFVQATQPRYAVFTVGYRNRFHHPHPDTLERYRTVGSELLRSDSDGALIIEMDAQNFTVESHRKRHARYWQKES